MKYLGWILFFLTAILGTILYVATIGPGIYLFTLKYESLQNRLEQQKKEIEMWMSKTEQAKHESELNETRQQMAPDVSLLLADVFPGVDSFNLTRLGQDTLAALATQLRPTKGSITVTVYTDDNDVSLTTKLKYANAWALAAAKAAVVTRYLQSKGIPAERLLLQAFGGEREQKATLPDLRPLSSRRLEIRVKATP